MRTAVYAALLIATPAAAQPVTQPKACQVTIARAPDDVRAVVETWVKSEAQCSVALEIRIVPTEGGLYLLAQDEHGRMRERIVPDAQTAGVLVASWIADDNAPAVVVPPPSPFVESTPVAPVASESQTESLTPPGLAPVSLTKTAVAPARGNSKWIAVGSLLPMSEGSGVGLRIEADIVRRGRWLFGAAASASESNTTLMSSSFSDGYLKMRDYKAMVYIARPSQFGRWEVRPAVGIGLIHSQGYAWDGSSYYDVIGTDSTGEASLMVSRMVGKSWALYTGALGTLIMEEFQTTSGSTPRTLTRGNLDLVVLGGVRHRL
ncbi:MAG TPA: hypothetical protein VIV40_00660 [Kofleriaceae bacterium]